MTLRWKHAVSAYVLVMAGAALIFTLGMAMEGYARYGTAIIAVWPAVFLTGLVCSFLPFFLFRALLRDIDDYTTASIGGAGLGVVAGVLLSATLIEWPYWLSILVFGALGTASGVAQLWLERAFDRRWPQ